MYIYTVHAIRWGNRENHSYLVGVYEKKHAALKVASEEEDYRGGKYTCEVLEWELGTKNKDNSPGMPFTIIKGIV